MRGSLQEQLLKAGLVNKESSTKKSKPKKTKSHNPKAVIKQPAIKVEVAPRKILADNELEKPVKLQIKQILKENRVNNKEGEIPYNYTVSSQIKRCYITQEQLDKLTANELAIVNWNDRSYLIPAGLLVELQQLHPDLRFFTIGKIDANSKAEDDPYKDFPIPDDLTW